MSNKENEMQDGPATPAELDENMQLRQKALETHCNTHSSSLLMESINRDAEGAFVTSNTGNNYLSVLADAINADENQVCDKTDLEPKEEDRATEEGKQLESIDRTGEVAAITSAWYSAGPSDGGIDGPIDPSMIVVDSMPQSVSLYSSATLLDSSPLPDFRVSRGNTSDLEKETYDGLVQLLQSSNSDRDGHTSTTSPSITSEKIVGFDGDVNEEETSEEEIVTNMKPIAVEVMRTAESDTKEVEDSSKDDTKSNLNKRSNLGEMGKRGEAKKSKKA